MSQKRLDLSTRAGFTLIEIIITLIVAGILGVMIYTLISAHSKSSVQSVLLVRENGVLIDAMERVDGHYRALIENHSLDLDSFKNDLDGIVHGVDSSISVESKFIDFDSNNREVPDTSGDHKFLKVTLTKDNISVVNLFSK
ncbi:prepilin-type N-terminal cleavage/methylation domain-containing protein [Desulfothermus okinawensis]